MMKDLLRTALAEFEPVLVAAIEPGEIVPRWGYTAPEGGLVVRVNTKIPGGYDTPANESQRLFQEGIGRDNFRIRQDEHKALAEGRIEESLLRRLARFHCVDNTRGEPPMWEPDEVQSLSQQRKDSHVEGRVHLKTADGTREFEADLFGFVEALDGTVTRFDLVVKGLFRGEGQYTRGAPKGDFPLGIRFTLADGSDIADSVPPQGSRGWVENYLQ